MHDVGEGHVMIGALADRHIMAAVEVIGFGALLRQLRLAAGLTQVA